MPMHGVSKKSRPTQSTTLSMAEIAMTRLPLAAVLRTLTPAAAFAIIFEFRKVPAFRRLGIKPA
jgi:hypothetical protein